MKATKLMVNSLLTLILGMFFLAGYRVSEQQPDENIVEVRLGCHMLEVPRKNVVSNGVPAWLRWLPGLDDGSNSALFRFFDHEVQEYVSGYQIGEVRFRDDIEIIIIALTTEDVNGYQNPKTFSQLGDLWNMQGSYRERRMEPHRSNGWYKVFREVEYPYSWALLNRYPDPHSPLPDSTSEFWVAHCLMLGPKKDPQPSCTSHFLVDDFLVEFSISEYNIEKIDKVKAFLRSEVESWIKVGGSCSEVF